eukprot:8495427-Heterocapsa_arctica.AAC.1
MQEWREEESIMRRGVEGRIPSKGMEDDDMGEALHAYWRRQRDEDNFIMANQDVYPTTDMPTMIKVEDIMITEERRDCRAH